MIEAQASNMKLLFDDDGVHRVAIHPSLGAGSRVQR
jgi:hypothetical protein